MAGSLTMPLSKFQRFEMKRMKRSDIDPLPDNPRRMTDPARTLLSDGLARDGLIWPLTVNLRTGHLVSGHQRLADLDAKEGFARGNDYELDVSTIDVSAARERELAVFVNNPAAMGTYDAEALAQFVQVPDFDLKAAGFSEEELRNLIIDWEPNGYADGGVQPLPPEPETVKDPEPRINKAAELAKKWKTRMGQIWDIADSHLYCGDCRQVPNEFWAGRKIRLVWTDPPYGVSYADKVAHLVRHNAGTPREAIQNDDLPPDQVRRLFRGALRVAIEHAELGMAVYVSVPPGPIHWDFVQGLIEAGVSYKWQLVWVKQQFVLGRSDYHFRHEPILYGWLENGPHYWGGDRSQDSVFQINKPHVSDLHPTTKPVELIARMVVNSSRAGEVVYDPFCGSGSTLLAAHQLARIGYGVEISPDYAAVVLERFAELGVIGRLIN